MPYFENSFKNINKIQTISHSNKITNESQLF